MISQERGLYFIAGGITFKGCLKMLSVALSLYFSTILKLTYYPIAILHQILNHSADVYHRAIFCQF